MTTTVFAARRIITMDPSLPYTTHVAVRDGRVLGVGSFEDLMNGEVEEVAGAHDHAEGKDSAA